MAASISEYVRRIRRAREAELGRQPHRAAKLFAEFQDRILFGTDSEAVLQMYATTSGGSKRPTNIFPTGIIRDEADG
jgi:hypothetical protein